MILKNKLKLNKLLSKYFINHYYMPIIQFKLTDKLKKIANTSIDVSDGLLADLDKMINKQKLSYKLDLKSIPISSNLKKVLDFKNLSKINFISRGDDYQILFSASKNMTRIIKKISLKSGVKITKIGTIQKNNEESSIVDHNNAVIKHKNKGYLHKF